MVRREPQAYSRKPIAMVFFVALQARIESGYATV